MAATLAAIATLDNTARTEAASGDRHGSSDARRLLRSPMLDDELHAASLEDCQNEKHGQHLSAYVCNYGDRLRSLAHLRRPEERMAYHHPNGVCLVLAAFILLMTMLPRTQKEAVAEALDRSK